jgi:hypothetical protein
MGVRVHAFFIALSLLAVSCGAEINKSGLSANEQGYSLIEKNCATNKVSYEPVTLEISKMFNDFQTAHPLAFIYIPPVYYNYKFPLVINLAELSNDVNRLKAQAADEAYLQNNQTHMAIELFYLNQNSLRFEGQKCSLPNLSTKQNTDLRPYLEMRDFCVGKNNSETCSSDSLDNLTVEEAKFVEEKTLKLCKSFDSNSLNCQVQYSVNKENRTIGELVSKYQQKFQTERYNKLFSLRDSHLKFQCEKSPEDVTQMIIKVYSKDIVASNLEILMKYVANSWSRNGFELILEIVDMPGSDVVEIFPTKGGISYVPDNNNRQVYLSQSLAFESQKTILAHEFGHVLGFPDCYTEFYDGQNKDLIYYEIDRDDTNIMCAIKAGVSVPDNYLVQLAQKSCVFN